MDDFKIQNGVLVKYLGSDPHVVIPEGVREISEGSLDLAKIKSLSIPNTVKIIRRLGEQFNFPHRPTVYYDCNLAQYLRIANESASIFNYSCKVMIKNRGKYVCLQELKEIRVPNDLVFFIGDWLSYCKMRKIVLGKKVKAVVGSLYMCESLKEVEFNDCVWWIGEDAFSDCVSLGPTITLPASVKRLDFDCFRNCQSLKTIYAHKGVTFSDDCFNEITHPVTVIDVVTKKEIYRYEP